MCIREVGDIARGFGLTAMIEFARTSTHLSTLPSTLRVIRAAAHAHVHFQDLLAGPRELIDNDSRLIPGDGIAPVATQIRTKCEAVMRDAGVL